ncbi:MAG: hypothetical protein KDE27_15740 [Planctomycetes bacterium]|nr:hypothetical protein [Planctomycetota bacterium]
MPRFAVPTLLFALLAAGCQNMPAPVDSATQSLVEKLASEYTDVVRLSVHAIPAGGDKLHAIASTSSDKRGMMSDPEDMRAVETGQTIVNPEGTGYDVTVPILQKNGAYTAAAGVTLKGEDRATAESTAKMIAGKIEAAMKM